MDNTVRIWDVRNFVNHDRCVNLLQGRQILPVNLEHSVKSVFNQFNFYKIFNLGHSHNFEKNLLRVAWSPDGQLVSAGSADKMLYIWEV